MSGIAIAHDQILTSGGAERVAFELARAFDAPIYAGRVDQTIVPDDVEVREVFSSRVAQWAYASHYMITDLYQMQGWQQQYELAEYDTVIINKTNPGWYIPPQDQTVVWYLHSTPRNLYDRYYAREKGPIKRYLQAVMRALYAPNIRYADSWVCNSEVVARRLKRYWDIEADRVVHPPVPVAEFTPDAVPTSDYYLSVGRLHPAKHTREIVETANDLGVRLIVAGEGEERETLEETAGETVELVGYVSEEEKRELLSGARAFIFNAANEDFGMTPIEAMASGTPVLGVNEGFTRFQIQPGRTGLLFERGELGAAIQEFEAVGVSQSEQEIADWASEWFGVGQFAEAMRAVVNEAQENAMVAVDWGTRREVLADGG